MRPSIIRVDQPTPCFLPENRDIFERIIEISVGRRPGRADSAQLRRMNRHAADLCGNCDERDQCLFVHGHDYALGVIAGASDLMRREFFEGVTA